MKFCLEGLALRRDLAAEVVFDLEPLRELR